mmetsp:Transcript_33760/g.71968  ORF Transcript_33760/g.71968 Transcript_33760/m.71968 type:complete len:215 (-) Transcript_33760:1956-2600(-)
MGEAEEGLEGGTEVASVSKVLYPRDGRDGWLGRVLFLFAVRGSEWPRAPLAPQNGVRRGRRAPRDRREIELAELGRRRQLAVPVKVQPRCRGLEASPRYGWGTEGQSQPRLAEPGSGPAIDSPPAVDPPLFLPRLAKDVIFVLSRGHPFVEEAVVLVVTGIVLLLGFLAAGVGAGIVARDVSIGGGNVDGVASIGEVSRFLALPLRHRPHWCRL